MQPRWVSGQARCIDDEVLFALARGELPSERLAEVETHLRDCADCRAVLGEGARSLGDAEPGAPSTIARYHIVSLVGAGASGVVYRAFDPNLKRTVAIKVLRPDLHGTPELSAHMLREAQAMARLSAPEVVAVYDVGVEDGAVYLVMEFVAGTTLAAWLTAAPRRMDEVLAVFRQAARGLGAAHAKGLVHRDFKPENVLVTPEGEARVTDFGLAREAELGAAPGELDAGASTELYAPTRGLVGTPAYMAPELFEGGRASERSDQFALAVALFSALFGRHPFRAGEGIDLHELSVAAQSGTLLSPAELALTGRRALRLYAVLTRALSADPMARFGSMAELVAALDGAVATPRRRVIALSAAALVVLLGAGLGVRNAFTHRGESPDTNAPRAVPTAATAPPPAPSNEVGAPAGPAEPSVDASARAPEPSPPTRPTKRRPRTRPDVRYKDWLKDPF